MFSDNEKSNKHLEMQSRKLITIKNDKKNN